MAILLVRNHVERRLPLPRSAMVVPFTCAPGFRSLTGIFTSGVQV